MFGDCAPTVFARINPSSYNFSGNLPKISHYRTDNRRAINLHGSHVVGSSKSQQLLTSESPRAA